MGARLVRFLESSALFSALGALRNVLSAWGSASSRWVLVLAPWILGCNFPCLYLSSVSAYATKMCYEYGGGNRYRCDYNGDCSDDSSDDYGDDNSENSEELGQGAMNQWQCAVARHVVRGPPALYT
jgi:hypothetical protein